MDLADKLIQINNQEVLEEKQGGQEYSDDLGSPTIVADKDNPVELKNNVDYYVCRIIVINNKNVIDNKQGRLHIRQGVLFIGNEPVVENDSNLNRLCKSTWCIPQHIKPQVWDRLREFLPDLSYDKIVINDHLAYNKKTGEVEWSDEKYITTGKGGFNI